MASLIWPRAADELTPGLVESLTAAAGDRDLSPAGQQSPGNFQADAGTATGHEHVHIGPLTHCVLLDRGE
jgi:hypothetical protein